jgi:hypothetical protein
MARLYTKELAKVARAIFKSLGFNSRAVSVRTDYFSMGSAIRITVKDKTLPLGFVKKVAGAIESISRCEYSGEILSGGNRYVSYRYSREVETALGEPYRHKIDAIPTGGSGIFSNGAIRVYRDSDSPSTYTVWAGDSFMQAIYSALETARYIGRLQVDLTCNLDKSEVKVDHDSGEYTATLVWVARGNCGNSEITQTCSGIIAAT